VTAVLQVAKEEIERGEVYYRRGRGGTALGRAVHSVLQTVELDADADIDDICRAQAAAESIPDKWKDVAKLVRSGLRTDTVKQAAASGSCHREVFISAPCCGRAVEGFIDLLFEQDGGLVIADYKTDIIEDDGLLPQNYEKYALQAGIYAFAVNRVTAKPIRKVVLIFLRSGREIVIEDIHSLLPQAEEAVRRGLNP
jgi:ATP-dependent helicase/nuclease subunit A